MKRFLNHLAAALTVALLFTSPVAYSANGDHTAIVEQYLATYGDNAGTGIVVMTQDDGSVGMMVIGTDTTTARLCDEFDVDYAMVGNTSYRLCD